MRELAVVIPVYNECEIVRDVVEDWVTTLSRLAIDFCLCLYDDGSTDGTVDILHALAKKYTRAQVFAQANAGHGPTILRGYGEQAPESRWLFQVDSDHELRAASFAGLWALRHDHDFLVGGRRSRSDGAARAAVSWAARGLVRTLFGTRVADVNSPFRLMRSTKFQAIYAAIPADTFAPNLLVTGLASRAGLRACEIAIPHHPRTTGTVSIRRWRLFTVSMLSLHQTLSFWAREQLERGSRTLAAGERTS